MRNKRHSRGFTLIEILVVVAILALLIAILLPSLARAREQVRATTCATNLRTLATAFIMYAQDNSGRFPGNREGDADWLGFSNKNSFYPTAGYGKQPEDGTLYKKYMSSEKDAYLCPSDKYLRDDPGTPELTKVAPVFSYTANYLMNGAAPEWAMGAHYRESSTKTDPLNYSWEDHRADMRPFGGVPLIFEEDPRNDLDQYDHCDGKWSDIDALSDRHLGTNGKNGGGNIAFTDGHAELFRLRPPAGDGYDASAIPRSFVANAHCIQKSSGPWVSATASGKDYGNFLNLGSGKANHP